MQSNPSSDGQTQSLNFWLPSPDKVKLLVQVNCRILQVTLDFRNKDLDLLLTPTEHPTKEPGSVRVDDLGFLNRLELANFLEFRILWPRTHRNLANLLMNVDESDLF